MRPRGRRAAPSPHTPATAPAPAAELSALSSSGHKHPPQGSLFLESSPAPTPQARSAPRQPPAAPAACPAPPDTPRAGPTRSPVRSDVHSGDTGVWTRRTPLARGEEARTQDGRLRWRPAEGVPSLATGPRPPSFTLKPAHVAPPTPPPLAEIPGILGVQGAARRHACNRAL